MTMRRRDFLVLLGGASATSLPAQGQQSTPPVIGYLSTRAPEESAGHTAAFLQGLEAAGYGVGRNVRIEYRWARGEYDRLPGFAAELVSRGVTITAAVGGVPSALAAKAATSAIPVVFLIGDNPVQVGLVQHLNRPGGNITGITLMPPNSGESAFIC